MKRIVGIDIGGTKCAVLTADVGETIHILDKKRFDTRAEKGFDSTWAELMDTLTAAINASDKPVDAIGISCGGPLNSRKGIIQSPPNLPGWDDIHIVEILQEKFGIPTFLQNDANACALVEWQLGNGRGCENMIFLTMGTGMGAGIIAEGKLLRGHTDMGGEVGHMRLRPTGPVGFGKAGSFEGFTSGGGIARLAAMLRAEWIANGDVPAWKESDDELTTKILGDYARSGDEHAIRLFSIVGEYLGYGLAILCDVLNPERIVIGSIFGRCQELLEESMWRVIREEALVYTCSDLQVLPAGTGEQLGDFAAIMVGQYGLKEMNA